MNLYRSEYHIYVFMDPSENGGTYKSYKFINKPIYIQIGYESDSKNTIIKTALEIRKEYNITAHYYKYFDYITFKEAQIVISRLVDTIGIKELGTGPLLNGHLNEVIFTDDNGNTYSKFGIPIKKKFGWPKGRKQSEEHIKKRSESLKGFVFSKERNEKIRQHMLNRKTPSWIYNNEHRALSWIVISPNGRYQHVHNLTQFCRENGLSQPSMSKIASGIRKTYKGWKCKKVSWFR